MDDFSLNLDNVTENMFDHFKVNFWQNVFCPIFKCAKYDHESYGPILTNWVCNSFWQLLSSSGPIQGGLRLIMRRVLNGQGWLTNQKFN